MNEVQMAKGAFENSKIVNNLEVVSFNDSFKSLLN